MTVSKDCTPYDQLSTTSELNTVKCCGVFSLRIGCLILGYVNLVYSTIQTVVILAITIYIGLSTHGFSHLENYPTEGIYDDSFNTVTSPTLNYEERPYLKQIGALLALVLVADITWVIVNICCLVGLHKKRPGPVKLYVGFASLRVCLSLVSFLYAVLAGTATAQVFISNAVDLGIGAYFIYLYCVYVRELISGENSALITHNKSEKKEFA